MTRTMNSLFWCLIREGVGLPFLNLKRQMLGFHTPNVALTVQCCAVFSVKSGHYFEAL